MRAKLSFIVLALILGLNAFGKDELPRNCAILPESEGPRLLHQYSRLTPEKVTEYWTQTSAQIAALEKQLPDFLSKSGHKIKLSKCYRQYLGVISNGKKIIYLNSF